MYYFSFFSLFAAGIAAALTTPLDVAKTRIMLAEVRTAQMAPHGGFRREIARGPSYF